MNTLNQENITVEYKVSKNARYGDWRVDEYFNGEWNNQRDNNWSKKQAEEFKTAKEQVLLNLNGALVVPSHCVTTFGWV